MVLVKRYPNRKLYNTAAKQYVTLDGLARLIRDGEEIRVIDHASGEDLTALTLTQVILELEKNHLGLLSHFPLADWIRSGGEQLNALQRGLFSHSFWQQIDEEIRLRFQSLVRRGELTLSESEALIEKLIDQGQQLREERRRWGRGGTLNLADLEEYLRQRQVPTQEDLAAISEQIDRLAEKIDRLPHP